MKVIHNYFSLIDGRIQEQTQVPVLVTGGAGFVGSSLCRVLLDMGCEVYAVDNLITGRKENIEELLTNDRFSFFELDINSPQFSEMFEDVPVRRVYHLACPTGVPNITILATEMLQTCSIGTIRVMDIAKKHNASVVFSSSCEVYGQPEVCPQPVSYTGNVSPIGPRCPYEEGKRFSESIMITYQRKYNIDAKIVRIFNTYGPRMSPSDQRVMPQFLKSILTGDTLKIYGDGMQTRTFCFVDDLVQGLLLAMYFGKPGQVFNVGGTAQITMRELAETMIELTGSKDAKIEYIPHFTEDHTNRMPDTAAIEELGWTQQVSLRDGLLQFIASRGKEDYGSTIPLAELINLVS